MVAKRSGFFSVLFIMMLALSGCDSKEDANVIVIATAGPMTGQYASFGEQMRLGAIQAVKDMENYIVMPEQLDRFLENGKLGEYSQ